MTNKVMTNAEGHICIKLPVCGTILKFRQPKGRDLVNFEQLALSDKVEYQTNTGTMAAIAAQLSVSIDVTFDTLLDLDAVDFLAVGDVVNSFSFLSQLQPNS